MRKSMYLFLLFLVGIFLSIWANAQVRFYQPLPVGDHTKDLITFYEPLATICIIATGVLAFWWLLQVVFEATEDAAKTTRKELRDLRKELDQPLQ